MPYVLLSKFLRKLATKSTTEAATGTDSPYVNWNFWYPRTDQSLTKDQVGDGPPSLYDNHGDQKKKKDMRRLGPNPGPNDPLVMNKEFNNGVPGNPKEDVQGNPSDNTTSKGRNEDRDTIGFNPGESEGLEF